METARKTNEEQLAFWNGAAGRGWVEAQESLDRLLQPFEDLLVEAVAARRPHCVLDVGCGTGSTTLALAQRLGAEGACIGLDISEPMLTLARARAERATARARFVCADAQTHAFEPASFDMLVSRFGVMFFDDPVRAFANLHRAARPSAALELIAWRGPEENPFMTTAERAAAPFLPALPPRRPNEPGQFAFADGDRVHSILRDGGWAKIDIRPIDVACALPEHELMPYLTKLGPVGRLLQEMDDGARAKVIETVRAAFEPYVQGTDVRFTAACWTIRAHAE